MANEKEQPKDNNKSQQEQQKNGNKQPNEQRSGRGEKNIFINKYTFPDANAIFKSTLKPLEEIRNDCCIVLDTNVLLLPYESKTEKFIENFMDLWRNTCNPLIKEGRLFVPGQVAREFAKLRPNLLGQLYKAISDNRSKFVKPSISKLRSSLLASLEEYNNVEAIEVELEQIIKNFINTLDKYDNSIKSIYKLIQSWRWNDPISILYSELFTNEVIFDPPYNEDEIRKDLFRRQAHHIPPGYLDSNKDDEGVGDLLIWNTILEIGRKKEKSVIFVSGDVKQDWWHQSDPQHSLFPRFELVDEFRRFTGGYSFHILQFADFLNLYGASAEVIRAVQLEEDFIANRNYSPLPYPLKLRTKLKLAAIRWLQLTNPELSILPDMSSRGLDCIVNDEATGIGIVIESDPYTAYEAIIEKMDLIALEGILSLGIISVSNNIETTRQIVHLFEKEKVFIGVETILNFGYLSGNEEFKLFATIYGDDTDEHIAF